MTRISVGEAAEQGTETPMSPPTARACEDRPSWAATASAIASLATITRRMMRQRLAAEEWVRDAGLRPPCFRVMASIDDLGSASQKQISDQLALDPSDMVSVVDVLERAGFVSRLRDPQDRRRYALTLTPDGRRALRRLEAIAAAVQHDVLAPLGEPDRTTFEQLLQRVLSHHVSAAEGRPA
jgi:DNA-binding MarR family transcriptional regulator